MLDLIERYNLNDRTELSAQEAVDILEEHFLGALLPLVDWTTNAQGNLITVKEILQRYPHPKYVYKTHGVFRSLKD